MINHVERGIDVYRIMLFAVCGSGYSKNQIHQVLCCIEKQISYVGMTMQRLDRCELIDLKVAVNDYAEILSPGFSFTFDPSQMKLQDIQDAENFRDVAFGDVRFYQCSCFCEEASVMKKTTTSMKKEKNKKGAQLEDPVLAEDKFLLHFDDFRSVVCLRGSGGGARGREEDELDIYGFDHELQFLKRIEAREEQLTRANFDTMRELMIPYFRRTAGRSDEIFDIGYPNGWTPEDREEELLGLPLEQMAGHNDEMTTFLEIWDYSEKQYACGVRDGLLDSLRCGTYDVKEHGGNSEEAALVSLFWKMSRRWPAAFPVSGLPSGGNADSICQTRGSGKLIVRLTAGYRRAYNFLALWREKACFLVCHWNGMEEFGEGTKSNSGDEEKLDSEIVDGGENVDLVAEKRKSILAAYEKWMRRPWMKQLEREMKGHWCLGFDTRTDVTRLDIDN